MTLPELMAWAAGVLPFAYWLFLSRTRGTGIMVSMWTFLFALFMMAEHNFVIATTSLALAGYMAGAVHVAFSQRDWLQGFSRFVLGFLTLLTGLGTYMFFGFTGELLPIVMLILFACSFGQTLALNARSYGLLDVKGGYED